MKPRKAKHSLRILSAALVALPLVTNATVFFNDTFGNGSTLNSATPADPTASSTAYQLVSARAWSGQTLAANQLRVGMVSSSSAIMECQALFTTNPIALAATGDYIQLTVVFTNTAGLLTTSATTMGFGLYNSGGINGTVKPVPGGLNGTLNNTATTAATGGAQNWLGYFGSINASGNASRIYNRAAQTGTFNQNQGTISAGTSSSPANPAPTSLASSSSTLALTVGAPYTAVLTITLIGPGSVAITNTLYSGAGTGGAVLSSLGATASSASFLTGSFDSLAIGFREATAATMDISAITVDGSVTTISTPPEILTQPVPVSVANSGSCIFNVVAQGFGMTYQWHRYGTNLLNGGNISGATSDTLLISSASAADVASGANG